MPGLRALSLPCLIRSYSPSPSAHPHPSQCPGQAVGPHPVEGTQWGVNEWVSERMNWVLDPLPLLFHLSSVPGAGGGAAGRWEGARSWEVSQSSSGFASLEAPEPGGDDGFTRDRHTLTPQAPGGSGLAGTGF